MNGRPVPDHLGGLMYRELEFGREGQLIRPAQVDAVRELHGQGVSDLVVISHGWNNDEQEAADLYRRFATSAAEVLAAHVQLRRALEGRTLALVGVFWPSKRFADADLIPGGAAGIDTAADALQQRIQELRGVFDAPDADHRLDLAAAAVDGMPDHGPLPESFVEAVRGLVVPTPDAPDHDAEELFATLDAAAIAERIGDPALGDPALFHGPAEDLDQGGAAVVGDGPLAVDTGGAAFLGLPEGPLRAAQRLLNYATYYQMKHRAGVVAARGLAPALRDAVADGQALHLVGHSFGARLVTATAAAAPRVSTVRSLSLLQAAFSHYGFAQDWEPGKDGAFRQVLTDPDRLSGPAIVTHTRNDTAVGIAYAIASRLAQQTADAIGDADSRYGGLGGNGARRTPEAVPGTLQNAEFDYVLTPRRMHNLLADRYVKNHGDVTGVEVANAVLSAIATP